MENQIYSLTATGKKNDIIDIEFYVAGDELILELTEL